MELLTYQDILKIYKAQVENVRFITSSKKHINITINNYLRKNNNHAINIFTKIYAITFCSWVEATFSKMIHTPYGFSPEEISQIKIVYQKNGLEQGWKKCIELGLKKISHPNKTKEKQNISLKLKNIADKYIVEPSLIRNKIAHGQWKIALNRENTSPNTELTNKVIQLDVVIISHWFAIFEYFAQIIESMIESPKKKFREDYWILLSKLEEYIKQSKKITLNQKIDLLKKKVKKR